MKVLHVHSNGFISVQVKNQLYNFDHLAKSIVTRIAIRLHPLLSCRSIAITLLFIRQSKVLNQCNSIYLHVNWLTL